MNRTLTRMLPALVLCTAAPVWAQSQPPKMTAADVQQLFKKLSNWGRWGANDQAGTINLITPEIRKRAVALVKDGVTVSLAHTIEKEKAVDNPSPFSVEYRTTGPGPNGYFMDTYSVSYHGYAHTHMDALSHMYQDGKTYNGIDVRAPGGAAKLSVFAFRDGIVSRGVLMDIPALKGVRYLEPGQAITVADLEAWEKKAGMKVGPGDIVLIRTGRWARRTEKGPWNAGETSAGLHASCAQWLRDRGVAMLGSDAASDVMPSGIQGVTQPVHLLVLVAMGMPILDNGDYERLSETAAKLKRWTFMLTIAPLAVEGGTGSPLNPIAMF